MHPFPKAEYLLWERTWKKQLRDLLLTYQRDLAKAHLTMDQLCGEGQLSKPQDQAANLPEPIPSDIKIAAHRALSLTPMASFTHIK